MKTSVGSETKIGVCIEDDQKKKIHFTLMKGDSAVLEWADSMINIVNDVLELDNQTIRATTVRAGSIPNRQAVNELIEAVKVILDENDGIDPTQPRAAKLPSAWRAPLVKAYNRCKEAGL